MLCILTEKVSARRNFETALGATYDKSSGCSRGTYAGEEFVLVNSVGHIMSFPKNPDELVSSSNAAKYKSWDLANLPWDETDFH